MSREEEGRGREGMGGEGRGWEGKGGDGRGRGWGWTHKLGEFWRKMETSWLGNSTMGVEVA